MSGTNQEIEGSTTVQSVTGSQVDNTDPNNPIVNPLGLIKIVDLRGELFTDLTTAKAYIRTFIDHSTYPITQESYQDGVYYFTTPINTEAMLLGGFMQNSSASFVDELGLICHFNQAAFFINIGNHIFGADMIFEGQSFYGTTGNTVFKKDVYFFIYPSFPHFENATGTYFFNKNLTLDTSEQFALNSNAKFIFSQNIGPTEGANYVGFFSGSTSTIFASASKYTSNAGGIEGDLQTAIANGCNVQFDGINLEQTANKQNSLTVDGTGVKYPTVDAVNTKGSIQNYYSGKRVTIPFAGTSSAINGWNGAIIYIPIPITSSVAFTDISQEVTALTVGSNIRLALYTSVNGLPSALLEDSGNISTSTTGIKNYVLSAPHSFTAVDKQVFVAIQSSNSAVGLRYALNTVCFNYFDGSGQSGTLFYQVQVFGAFPATATPSVYTNANSPLVSLLVQ